MSPTRSNAMAVWSEPKERGREQSSSVMTATNLRLVTTRRQETVPALPIENRLRATAPGTAGVRTAPVDWAAVRRHALLN